MCVRACLLRLRRSALRTREERGKGNSRVSGRALARSRRARGGRARAPLAAAEVEVLDRSGRLLRIVDMLDPLLKPEHLLLALGGVARARSAGRRRTRPSLPALDGRSDAREVAVVSDHTVDPVDAADGCARIVGHQVFFVG
jgi:hypothetical protein